MKFTELLDNLDSFIPKSYNWLLCIGVLQRPIVDEETEEKKYDEEEVAVAERIYAVCCILQKFNNDMNREYPIKDILCTAKTLASHWGWKLNSFSLLEYITMWPAHRGYKKMTEHAYYYYHLQKTPLREENAPIYFDNKILYSQKDASIKVASKENL